MQIQSCLQSGKLGIFVNFGPSQWTGRSSKGSRKTALMNTEILTELNKKKVYKRWKREQVTQKEHRVGV